MIFVCFALTLMSFIVEYILGKLDCRGHFRFIIFLKRRDMYKDIITKYFNFKALLNMSIFSQLKKKLDGRPAGSYTSIYTENCISIAHKNVAQGSELIKII